MLAARDRESTRRPARPRRARDRHRPGRSGRACRYRDDDLAWEARIDQLKQLRATWQRQGVLAMLHRWLHEMELPARLLSEIGGERC